MKTKALFFTAAILLGNAVSAQTESKASVKKVHTSQPAQVGHQVVTTTTDLEWHLLGNSETAPSLIRQEPTPSTSNFLGTTDDQDLVFRKNRIRSGIIQTPGSNIPGTRYASIGNTAFGYDALSNALINTGGSNTAFGAGALRNIENGFGNIGIGTSTLYTSVKDVGNVAIGYSAMLRLGTGSTAYWNSNVAIGTHAAQYLEGGNNNVIIGGDAGEYLKNGNGNIFIGSVSVPNASATSSSPGYNTTGTIIFSSINPANAAKVQRFYIHSNGFAGIGLNNNVIPKNTLEVLAVTGSPTEAGYTASGLRLSGLSNSNFNAITGASTPKVLSVNSNGDVILVDDKIGAAGVTSTCATNGFIPVTSGSGASLACSQIYDDGTSVGIGTTGSFAYTWSGGLTGSTLPASSGTLQLDVNGVTRGLAFMATSDKKFKKDIKPIENALETIEAIDGRTYKWNKESSKEINFDDGDHSGFIAQELEKVLPHLVATYANGDKAVNYMELLPYLVEAIKEQQAQINELKTQLTQNFKKENSSLINLKNTKIVSVSPNPSSSVISISLNIEKTVQSAKLQIFDVNGVVLNTLSLNERGTDIAKTLQKDNFGSGIYIVSLVVEGKSIDSKKIIFN